MNRKIGIPPAALGLLMALVVPRNVATLLTKTNIGKTVLATNKVATVQQSKSGVSYTKIVTPATKVKPYVAPPPVAALKKEVRTGGIVDTRVPTNFPSNTPSMGAAGGINTGVDYGAFALGIGDVALDVSPVGVGMGLLGDIGNLAGMSLNALGIGSKKKAGVGGYGRRRHGASYWRNRYEAMYWKAKYETARYGHGRMK